MKQFIKKIVVMSFVLIAFTPNAHAVVAGSDNSVSIQSHTIFPAADSDNAMNGFGWFKNGFTLENAATACLFNSIYPVGGTINGGNGTITLLQDMVFKDTIVIGSFATFIANNRNMDFTRATLIGSVPPAATFENANIFTGGNFNIVNSFKFRGTCLADGGNANITFLGPLAEFAIQSNSTLTLRNMTLKNIANTRIRCVDDSAKIVLNNVRIETSGNFSFSLGSILFANQVDWVGSHTFTYDSSQTSTIAANSTLSFSKYALFSTGKVSANTTVQPLAFTDATSVLGFNNAGLRINSNGAQFLKGTLQVSNNVVVDALGTSTANGLEVGNGIQSNDFFFNFDSGSLYAPGGFQIFNDIQQNVLLSRVGGATIAAQPGSTIYINQNQTITNLTSRVSAGTQTIVAPGKTLSFDNLTVITQLGSFTLNAIFVDANANLLAGGQSIILSGGLPVATVIANPGNLIAGAGFILAPIIFQDSNAQLLWAAQALLGADITMNGGTLTLLNDLTLANGNRILGQGLIEIDDHNLSFGQTDFSLSDTLYFEGTAGGKVSLNSNIALSGRWTFSGDCSLDGAGHILDLTNGEILVEQGSHLILENFTLKGLSGSNIRCLDDAAHLRLNKILWIQDTDFTFPQGTLSFDTFVTFRPEHTFAYQSTQTITIADNAVITMDNGFTFSYDPGTFPNLIHFTDKTSQLFLNQATIHATAQGLQLTKGTMVVNGFAILESEIVDGVDNGITLGDCFNSENDFAVNLASAVNLTIASGSLNYKNLLSTSWLIVNDLTIGDNTSLNVYQTLSNGTAITTFGVGATLGIASGSPCFAAFNGSVSGSPSVTVIPCC